MRDKTVRAAVEVEPVRPMLRYPDIEKLTRLARRTIERLISAEKFPAPDRRVGRVCLWRQETVEAWMNGSVNAA